MNTVLLSEPGVGGAPVYSVRGVWGEAQVQSYGAHVMGYTPAGHKPLLFVSKSSKYEEGAPIRGGAPICFPWFGAKSDDENAPMHGLARTAKWDLHRFEVDRDGDAELEFRMAASGEQWGGDLAVSYLVTMGSDLQLTLQVWNRGEHRLYFEAALHTYFSVSDIANVSIEGLAESHFTDKVDGMRQKVQDDELLYFTQHTDRIYHDVDTPVAITDTGWQRVVYVVPAGSRDVVVWNPWSEKAAAMPDFGDDEWRTMLCVETACVGDNAVRLEPGAQHLMRVVYSVE